MTDYAEYEKLKAKAARWGLHWEAHKEFIYLRLNGRKFKGGSLEEIAYFLEVVEFYFDNTQETKDDTPDTPLVLEEEDKSNVRRDGRMGARPYRWQDHK